MKTRRFLATCVVVLLSVAAVMAKDIRIAVFTVEKLHCESCVRKVHENMKFEKGVKKIKAEIKDRTATITYDADKTDVKKLQAGFQKFDFEAVFVKEAKQEDKKNKK